LAHFPATGLFFFSCLLSISRSGLSPQLISPCASQSHRCLAPVFLIIPFKPNIFSKENNSKTFSETPFYKNDSFNSKIF
jgi:hypothetical protein